MASPQGGRSSRVVDTSPAGGISEDTKPLIGQKIARKLDISLSWTLWTSYARILFQMKTTLNTALVAAMAVSCW